MGWWCYHTNSNDGAQDVISEMIVKLRILNYGFGERLLKQDKEFQAKHTEGKNVRKKTEEETTEEEELQFFQNEKKSDEIYSDEEKAVKDTLDPDEQNDHSWWNKRYKIERYVKENIKDLSSTLFIIAGIAWELHERSGQKDGTLSDDFPEDLRIMALESAKAFYETIKIDFMVDPTKCKNYDKSFAYLQEEIDVFSRKK